MSFPNLIQFQNMLYLQWNKFILVYKQKAPNNIKFHSII